MLIRISKSISELNTWVGEKVSWLSLILVCLICIDVVFRYLFSFTQTWIIELEWHLFSLLFLLSAGYTLNSDEHVRVDVFYEKYSPRSKAILNLFGTLLLLIPWCIIIIKTSFNTGINSLYMLEGSPNPGGLPARYLIKFSITLAFSLLLLQAISKSIDYILIIKTNQKDGI